MEALKQVEELFSAKVGTIKTVFALMRLEAKLAGLSILPLLINLGLLLVVLMSFWLCTSALIGYGIFWVSQNIPLSIFLTLLINLIVVFIVARNLSANLKNMSFEKTRLYFSQDEDRADEPVAKAIKNGNSSDGQEIETRANAGAGE